MTFADPSDSLRTPAGFRTLVTARGAFILPWRPDAVKYLLCTEALGPAELAVGGRDAARALARDLFLLGLQDEMGATDDRRSPRSPISRVARGLLRLLGDRRG
jgi:hypothetical protein